MEPAISRPRNAMDGPPLACWYAIQEMVSGVCASGLASPRLVADHRQAPASESLRSAVRGCHGLRVVIGRAWRIHTRPLARAHSMSCGTPAKMPSMSCAHRCSTSATGRSASGPVYAPEGRARQNSVPVLDPDTRLSPSPSTTLPVIRPRSPVSGSAVNSTPACSAGTSAWTTTATSP